MTEYEKELQKVLEGIAPSEQRITELAFKLGWDAAIGKAITTLFDIDYSIPNPNATTVKEGQARREAIWSLHSWEGK